MFLISWNVAGLSTTLGRIDSDFKGASIASSSIPGSKLSRSHAFSYFLKRHGDPDIVCIQEHKIPLKQLSSRSEPFGCADVDGYESFWSCCTDAQKRGFNGVVTYAKKGTVQFADSRPLGCDELDNQGRVVMTDHGAFVVFNVYAPASGGNSLTYKMKFLNALRRAMRYQREECKKKVILVGDLNISHSGIDVYYRYRSIRVNDILHQVEDAKNSECNNVLPDWKLQVAEHWSKIETALSTLEAKQVETKNITNGNTFLKFRAVVNVNDRKVFIGGYEQTELDCIANFQFPESRYYDEDLEEERMSKESNHVYIDTLAELMSKIASVTWDEPTLKDIANTDGLFKSSPIVEWLNDVLQEDNMCDIFRYFWPKAQGRFTCWNQQTNRRYENAGTRIDYTIVDQSLVECVKKSEHLRSCEYNGEDYCSDEASLHAATASNQFQGASFGGGGISNATMRALETQFGESHTGMIYTPPSYSDHIAVSLKMNQDFERYFTTSLVLKGNTKKSQPHKTQKSISSFFGKSSSILSSNSSGSSSSKRKFDTEIVYSKKNKGTILAHFTKGTK